MAGAVRRTQQGERVAMDGMARAGAICRFADDDYTHRAALLSCLARSGDLSIRREPACRPARRTILRGGSATTPAGELNASLETSGALARI